MGVYRDTLAAGTFREIHGEPWYLHCAFPEWEVEGYPELGAKGTENQPLGLEKFVPKVGWF
jgi:hypothetical protein